MTHTERARLERWVDDGYVAARLAEAKGRWQEAEQWWRLAARARRRLERGR